MKYVFLDSNTFFNHWHLMGADLTLLANFLKNSHSVLLASELVCEEVQNLYKREQGKAMADLKKSYDKIQRFSKDKSPYSFDHLIQAYDFKQVLKEKMEFVEFFDYGQISQKAVTARAISKTLPFRENEKGYRDTLIWLSLLEFLKEKKADDSVAFINQNSNDFYNTEGSNLHADLLQDLLSLKISCPIKVYSSLNAFVKAEVETNEYEFTHKNIEEQYLEAISRDIELEIQEYMNHLPTQELKKLVDSSGTHLRYTTTLTSHHFEITEGIEDGEVISYKRLSAETLYINYRFNLRRCELILTISETELISHKFGIELFYQDSYLAEDEGYVIYYCRPEFTISFIYNTETESITGLELLKLKFL